MTATSSLLSIPAAVALSAWSLVGVSTPVTVTATGHTLTEPAGVQQGDILIACIASRIASTTSITLPSGWTLVNESKTNNVVAGATTGVASGMMAWIIRGAAAPALTFTHPTAPSVAMGNIVAYRNNAGATPVDVNSAAVTATNVTAVSVAGLTSTLTEDLLVAMTAGGRAATWSSFNATTPSGASGATDTATPPSATWRERMDATTTTGADTSLGIFDAIKTDAGATGNFTVTASLGAGHVVIAAAIKRLTTAFDPHKAAPTMALSNGNLTVTKGGTNTVHSKVGGVHGNSTGKFYYEATLVTNIDGNAGIGIIGASSDFQVTDGNSWLGQTSQGAGWYPGQNQVYHFNGSIGAFTGSSAVAGNVIGVAYDIDAKLIWFRLQNGNWNGSGTANPATGVGGFSMANINGIMVPCINLFTNTQAITINGGGSAFSGTPPAGFKPIGTP